MNSLSTTSMVSCEGAALGISDAIYVHGVDIFVVVGPDAYMDWGFLEHLFGDLCGHCRW